MRPSPGPRRRSTASDLVASPVAPEPAALEGLEPRTLMSFVPSLGFIPDQTVLAGSPLFVPLSGRDPDGGPVTYTATSSNTGVVGTSLQPRGNRSLRMVTSKGTMQFSLFENLAPRVTSRIIQLANSNFYNGVIFHRVINNFVIQGGDPTGTGSGGSNLGDFDDQFHPDLQHNRTGLLSMAKSGDDTNDSQFFITEGPQRNLDFNHSIFGVLTSGELVRDAISNVAVDGSDKPTTPVTMTDVSVVVDTQTGVLMLKVPPGVASGTSTITVTARDAEGKTALRTFTVTVQADNKNGAPYLRDIPPLRTEKNQPFTFRLQGVDVEGSEMYFDALEDDPNRNFTVTRNTTTGVVTVTPPTDFTGNLRVLVGVRGATAADTVDAFDRQIVTVRVVNPVAPDVAEFGLGDDTAARAKPVVVNGAPRARNIDSFSDLDWVKFTIAQKSNVTIRAAGVNGEDVQLLLRGPTAANVVPGVPNAAVALEGAQQTVLTRAGTRSLNPGTYWVRVDGRGSVVPTYTIQVQAVAVASAPALARATSDETAAAALAEHLRRQAADDTRRADDKRDDADVLLESEPILPFLA